MMKYILLAIVMTAFTTTMNGQDLLLLKTNGKVVIGDTSVISTPGSYSLYVQNGILTERVKVSLKESSDWSDTAFSRTPTITEVKESIEINSHLPEIPSAATLVKEGYDLQSMDAKLLAQIEWLWQHTIKLSEENEALRIEMEMMKSRLKNLESN